MRFDALPLAGAYLIDLDRHSDERGFFARAWCSEEFSAHGLDSALVQCNLSFNHRRGTVRGLHYQVVPHAERKVVRCIRGHIFDVIVDLRDDSPTFGRWHAEELSAENRRALYIPEGFAHGFQTLTDDSEVFYQMSEYYHPECARGIRWDSPKVGIRWPIPDDPVLSERDRGFPDLPC